MDCQRDNIGTLTSLRDVGSQELSGVAVSEGPPKLNTKDSPADSDAHGYMPRENSKPTNAMPMGASKEPLREKVMTRLSMSIAQPMTSPANGRRKKRKSMRETTHGAILESQLEATGSYSCTKPENASMAPTMKG